jgi:hypothetical protein
MVKEGGTSKDPAGLTTTLGSLKRKRSNDSFNSMWSEKLDISLQCSRKMHHPSFPLHLKYLQHYKRSKDLTPILRKRWLLK